MRGQIGFLVEETWKELLHYALFYLGVIPAGHRGYGLAIKFHEIELSYNLSTRKE